MVCARAGLRASSSDFNLLFKNNYPIICECISHATSTTVSVDCHRSSTAPSSSGTECTSISEPIFKVALRRFAINKGSFSGLELLSEPPRRHQHILHDTASLSERVARWLSSISLSTQSSFGPYSGTYHSTEREDSISSSEYQSTSSGEDDSRLLHLTSVSSTSPKTNDEKDRRSLVHVNEIMDSSDPSELFFPNPAETHLETKKGYSGDSFDPSDSLTISAYTSLLSKHIPSLEEVESFSPGCVVMGRKSSGTFHVVQFLMIVRGPAQGTYVVKIPRSGVEQTWTDFDAWNLCSEAETMILINKKSKCLAPEVLGYQAYLPGSVIDVPYILMKAIDGVSAFDIWHNFDQLGNIVHESQLSPDEQRQSKQKRVNFVESLVENMASLSVFEFSRSGVLFKFLREDSYKLGNTNTWIMTNWHEISMTVTPSFDSPYGYWNYTFNSLYCSVKAGDSEETVLRNMGRAWIMKTILSTPAFQGDTNNPEAKNFALRHEDLDLQNILCDPETGVVTGIIDWDRCRAVPRPIAYSSLPLFLIRPWHPKYEVEPERLSPQEVTEYSRLYANAMHKAIGNFNNDAQFTLKSGMYQAVNSSLYGSSLGDRNTDDVIQKIIAESDVLRRMSIADVYLSLGKELQHPRAGYMVEQVRNELYRVMSPVGNEE
ncbi:unnamed protein product [Periconia digitata]|uniref:Aminoglycoside phosphotransferase domain-containing protein n=1 Tax=Periconia digitata TaxID=1303443 RepID=A0A9W4XPP8_9PLEO|nr:unnamed protein product [Periconia digitata]